MCHYGDAGYGAMGADNAADNAAARKLCPWRRAGRLREPLCRCEKAGQSVKTRKTERLRSQTGSIKKKKRVRSGDRKALTFQCCSGVLHTLRILTCVVGFHYGQLTLPLCVCISSRSTLPLQLGKSGFQPGLCVGPYNGVVLMQRLVHRRT